MADISKKNPTRPSRSLQRVVQLCRHPLSQRSRFAPPLDPATGKDIARIWFSEKKMSPLATLAPGPLFSAARRGPQTCRTVAASRARAADRSRSIGTLPSSTGWRTTSAPPGREISATAESYSVLHSTFAHSRPLTSGLGAIVQKS
jgi:hypothetical protein